MKLLLFTIFTLIQNIFFFSYSLSGQEIQAEPDTLRRSTIKVFLDCRRCDMNYIREEIPYINYVRDVGEAQVYILITDQNSGSGGNQYTFKYQGQREFKGMDDTLVFTSGPDQTRPIVREKITNMLKLGLMRYVARTPLFDEIYIGFNEDLKMEEVTDRWNNWVVELQTSPRFNSEQSYKNLNLNNSIQISRITKKLKFEMEIRQNFNRQRFIEDDNDTTYVRSSKSIDNLIVRSLGDHWSAGIRYDIGSSTRENYKFNAEFRPALEYNLFPYSEATHRQLRFQYGVGVQYSSYNDTTIYNKMRETLYKERLNVAYQVQEKWGRINLSFFASNYFNDFSKNRVGLNGYVRIRIFKGLSVSMNGGISYLNDRLNLNKGVLTEAERLLRLKQQASNYELWGGASLTYVFGSIYNNVVNPRFGNGGGN